MKTADTNPKKAVLDGLLELFGQNRRWLLFFGTGTSCDLDPRFGMSALQEHLSHEFADHSEWAQVDSALRAGNSLEQALTGIGLSSEAKRKFRSVTGDFVAEIDRQFRDPLLLGERKWVGTDLLKALLDRMPPSNPRLSVMTSNYDRLIEYSCAANRIRWTTGFVGEVTRTWNWEAAQSGFHSHRVGKAGARSVPVTIPMSRIELFKVHGSINRFSRNGQQFECDLWAKRHPEGVERDLAIPGTQKYEQVATSNMDTMSRAIHAINEAQAFAFIGYGFNDPHLHEKPLERVRQSACPLLIITLDLDHAKVAELRNGRVPVWVLAAPKLPSGGHDLTQTLVHMPGQSAPLILEDEQLWNCRSFATRILGG